MHLFLEYTKTEDVDCPDFADYMKWNWSRCGTKIINEHSLYLWSDMKYIVWKLFVCFH